MKNEKFFINLHNFRQIYDRFYDPLCRYLLFYTENIETIEDIIQEIFLSLWENRDRLEIEYPKTYLFKMARNKVLNHLRDQKRGSIAIETWFEEQLENRLSDNEKPDVEHILKNIERAISKLPPKCKEIFLLCKIEHLTYQQIAELKQISRKTVEVQMGIALKKIRDYLASHPSFPLILTIFYHSF